MAVPGVTIGWWAEDAVVTNGTVAVPCVTHAGVAWIQRDAQTRLSAQSTQSRLSFVAVCEVSFRGR
jgi:hypothetical protein